MRDVWFVLHGYAQLARDIARYCADLAGDASLVVAPEALNRFYTVAATAMPARDRPVGATWMTRDDRDAEIADYVAYLDALHDAVARDAVNGGAAVHVLGFSQGAATAARWAALGRTAIDHLVLWGGLVPPDTDLAAAAARFARQHVTLVAGTRDGYVSADALAADRARLADAGVAAEVIQFDGGHAISRAVLRQVAALSVRGR